MPEIFTLLKLVIAEIAACYKNPVMPEAPVCDVMYGKQHQLLVQ